MKFKNLILIAVLTTQLITGAAISFAHNSENSYPIYYLKRVYVQNNQYYVSVDKAEFFSGNEASKAALEDGFCDIEELDSCLPNGFYIRNKSQNLRDYPISKSAAVYLFATGEERVNLRRFLSTIISDDSALKYTPYTLKFKSGTVTNISEQYIP